MFASVSMILTSAVDIKAIIPLSIALTLSNLTVKILRKIDVKMM